MGNYPDDRGMGTICIQKKRACSSPSAKKRLNAVRSKTPNDTYRDALLGWELMVTGSLPLTRIKFGGL